MTTDDNQKSTSLPALFTGILEHGGLSALSTQKSLFLLSDSAEELFIKHDITSTNNLLSLVFMMHTFGDSAVTIPLLTEGYRRGLLQKSDLVTLYLSQSEDARISKPLITLQDIWNMPFIAFPKDRDTASLAVWFSKEELIAIANQVITVHHNDIDMFFKNWFYHSNEATPCSKEFLLYWFNYPENNGYSPSGKVASLIAIALFIAHPECINQDDVLKKMYLLAGRNPESHGIYRYCSLSFQIAGNDPQARKKAVDGWVNTIVRMIWVSKNTFSEPEFALEIFLDDVGISKEEKREALRIIHEACKEKALVYTNLIKVTQDRLEKL